MGLAGFAEVGVRLQITDYLMRLAEAQALDGLFDDALRTTEEALQANPEELVFQPHILTFRGELRLRQRQAELAAADFRDAITLAQKMSAKAYEHADSNGGFDPQAARLGPHG
jgi:tetratricopeptide (TPR) repeat protein